MRAVRPGPVTALVGGLTAVFLLSPLLAVIPVSFTARRYLSMPEGNWSLRHYRALIEQPEWGQSALLSLEIGLASAVLAVGLALAFCLGLWMYRPRHAGLLAGLALLPMLAPPVVSALTLFDFLKAMTRWNDVVAYDSPAGVAVAHAVMSLPYAVVVLMVALSQVDRRIDLAAKSMGAGVRTRILRVILPNIRLGVGGAFLLCFILSWDEIGTTLFITSVRAVTLPRRMWMGIRDSIDPTVAAISVLLIILVTAAVLIRALWQLRTRKDT